LQKKKKWENIGDKTTFLVNIPGASLTFVWNDIGAEKSAGRVK